jgi:hypothetical protein
VSTDAVMNRCPKASTKVPVAAQAAMACAAGPPPTSRAIRATRNAVATAQSTAGTRRPHTESPKTSIDSRVSSGVAGGWSMYPQAGCWPSTRK